MFKGFKLRTALLCTAGVVLLAPSAFGQGAESTETVVVTGSRVITDITTSPTPITAVSTDQLAATSPKVAAPRSPIIAG